jgi:hypothetical protein
MMLNNNEKKNKEKYSLEERKKESRTLIQKNENCIPIIFEKGYSYQTIQFKKSRFIVSLYITIGQLVYIIRNYYSIDPFVCLFLFINGNIPSNSSLILDVYNREKDEDGFLYIQYFTENTFG